VTVTRTQSVGVALGQATQNTEAGLPKLKGLKMPSVQTYSIVQSDNRSPNGSIQTRGTTEEEWVTKKTVEITTTKNIERKVHRQLVLEDGRVLDEEVPTVTIDRTEDKQIFETDHDEERDFDNHDNDMAVHSTFTTNNGDKFTTVKTTKDVKENMTRTEAVQNIGNIRSRVSLAFCCCISLLLMISFRNFQISSTIRKTLRNISRNQMKNRTNFKLHQANPGQCSAVESTTW